MALQPPMGQVLLIIEASRSYSDTPHSVGLLWTSDQADTETSTLQHTTPTRDRHPRPLAGFEPTIPASERPRIHVSDRAATGIGSGRHNTGWNALGYIFSELRTVRIVRSTKVYLRMNKLQTILISLLTKLIKSLN
jgi:hypothetical protein